MNSYCCKKLRDYALAFKHIFYANAEIDAVKASMIEPFISGSPSGGSNNAGYLDPCGNAVNRASWRAFFAVLNHSMAVSLDATPTTPTPPHPSSY